MNTFDHRLIPICREILLKRKAVLLKNLWRPFETTAPENPNQLALSPSIDREILEEIRRQIYEVEHALAKIQNGVFGYCEQTGQPMGRFFILSEPWARSQRNSVAENPIEKLAY